MPESVEIPTETLEPLAQAATEFVSDTQDSFVSLQESLDGINTTLDAINSGVSTLSVVNTYAGNKEQTVISSFQRDDHVYLYVATNLKNLDNLSIHNTTGQLLTHVTSSSCIYDLGTVEQVISSHQGYYAVAYYDDYRAENEYYIYSDLYIPAESLEANSTTLQIEDGTQVMTRDEMLQGFGDFSFLMIAILAALLLNLGVNLFRSFRSR